VNKIFYLLRENTYTMIILSTAILFILDTFVQRLLLKLPMFS